MSAREHRAQRAGDDMIALEIKRVARTAGWLYLAMSVLAIASYFGLDSRFEVHDDPAATAARILAGEQLYRINILLKLVGNTLFVLVVATLHRLFQEVDRHQAHLMVALVGVGIAAQLGGLALEMAPLMLLRDSHPVAVLGREHSEFAAYLALRIQAQLAKLLTWIWGVWLFPFAILVIRSRFLPKALGFLLLGSGTAYVATGAVAIALPRFAPLVSRVALPLYFGEFVVVLWLALVGARPRPKIEPGEHAPGIVR
ncbi:MAG: DUF4386 domain-containing protein [Candidatus Eisenbacteria bacterium]